MDLDTGRLNKIIEQQGRTRKWIAEQCGLSPHWLGQVLNGRRKAGLPLMKLLARVLEVPEDRIIKKTAS